jgi:hypothetical protein
MKILACFEGNSNGGEMGIASEKLAFYRGGLVLVPADSIRGVTAHLPNRQRIV